MRCCTGILFMGDTLKTSQNAWPNFLLDIFFLVAGCCLLVSFTCITYCRCLFCSTLLSPVLTLMDDSDFSKPFGHHNRKSSEALNRAKCPLALAMCHTASTNCIGRRPALVPTTHSVPTSTFPGRSGVAL